MDSERNSTGEHWVNLGLDYDYPDADHVYFPAVTNVMELITSVIRLDFGLVLPNNPYLSTDVLNATLQNPFPASSPRFQAWPDIVSGLLEDDPTENHGFNSFLLLNSTYLDVDYTCRFRQPLPWGMSTSSSFANAVFSSKLIAQAAVNVMVATLSLFTSGWALAMSFVGFLASHQSRG